MIVQQLDKILKRALHLDDRDLLRILLHSAWKCILTLLILEKAPIFLGEICDQFHLLSRLPHCLKGQTLFIFWDPFFIGATKSQRLKSGLKDLAWKRVV